MSHVQIGKFKYKPQVYDIKELINIIKVAIKHSLLKCQKPGLLLSGGVDSTVMATLIKEVYGDIRCVTIGRSKFHPDLIAGRKITKILNLVNISKIIDSKEIEKCTNILKKSNTNICSGDAGVLAALSLCKENGIEDVIATDGIDEMMGGYWWHVNKSDKFSTTYEAFEHFWNELDPLHLIPLLRSADIVNVKIHLPYLDKNVIEYISKIPLNDRVKKAKTKYLWKRIARHLDVPQWVIDRPKIGFVDALKEFK